MAWWPLSAAMARGLHYSPHQKGLIRRYYQHRGTIMTQRLGEVISELYLCADHKKLARLWKSAEKALLGAGADRNLVQHVVGERNVEALAEVAADLF